MKHRQNHWYVVKEPRAKAMEARGFAIKQKSNGKWMVMCHVRDLMQHELDRKGIDYTKVIIESVS